MKPRKLTRRKAKPTRDECERSVVALVVDERAEDHATPAESETSARPRKQSGTQARRGGTYRKAAP